MATNLISNDDAVRDNDMANVSRAKIMRDEIKNFARMPETGDYATDCETGRRTAEDLIMWMAKAPATNTPALGKVVQELVERGRWEAVHIGFFQRLADRSLPAPA
ncbi:hypothetical protein [Sphingomonas sp. R86521]|uniref:hypothetical protein n=1 Tax=Sphingomonas sp. R86521 TaxID=3093860 RepID=UPI0036D29979